MNYYHTPLHLAAILKKYDIVEKLIKCGANREIEDCYGKKAADYINSSRILKLFA